MQEHEEQLDETVDDIETVRGTLEALDLSGTSEGSAAIEQAIERADSATVELFDSQDTELESVHEASEAFEGEVHEQVDAVQSNQDRIREAGQQVESSPARDGLESANEVADEDREFLEDQEERARAARETSERAQQEFRNRAHGH
jgi:hypothetical protein